MWLNDRDSVRRDVNVAHRRGRREWRRPGPSACAAMYLYRVANCGREARLGGQSPEQRDRSLDYWLAVLLTQHLIARWRNRPTRATGFNCLPRGSAGPGLRPAFSPATYLEQVRKTAHTSFGRRRRTSTSRHWISGWARGNRFLESLAPSEPPRPPERRFPPAEHQLTDPLSVHQATPRGVHRDVQSLIIFLLIGAVAGWLARG